MAMEVVPRALKGPESRAFGADGGYYYPASLEEGRTRAEISELVSERIMAKDVYGLANWDFSSFRFGLLVDFVQDLQKNGTQVMLLGPPYHPDAYRLLQQRRDVSELLGVYERALVDVGFRTGASVCSSLDPSLVVCGEEDFIDEMHMRRTCYSKFLSHCLQTDRAWEHLDRRP
jgi:hypothetical protein